MRRNSVLSFIMTYVLIVFLVIGINLLLYIPAKKIINKSNSLNQEYINQTANIQIDGNVKSTYEEYDSNMQEVYEDYFRIFTNMIIALLVIISLTLVIVGLSLRVNSNRNKGVHNAITLAGISIIFYLFYFILNISNSFGMLF